MNAPAQLPHPDRYTYRTEWNHDEKGFVATVAEFPTLRWIAQTPESAQAGLKGIVHETLLDLVHSSGTVPTPLPAPEYNWAPQHPQPAPSYYPTFQMPHTAAGPSMGAQQSVNVVVGGPGRYHTRRNSRRGLHIALSLLTCGLWVPVWVVDELLNSSGSR